MFCCKIWQIILYILSIIFIYWSDFADWSTKNNFTHKMKKVHVAVAFFFLQYQKEGQRDKPAKNKYKNRINYLKIIGVLHASISNCLYLSGHLSFHISLPFIHTRLLYSEFKVVEINSSLEKSHLQQEFSHIYCTQQKHDQDCLPLAEIVLHHHLI